METDNIGARLSLMTNRPSVARISCATRAGLFLSLFAMVVIRHAFVFFVPEITFGSAILKETLIWASAAALIVIIRRGEHLPLRSIGLGTARWWKSILWGLVIAVVSGAIVGVLAYVTGLCGQRAPQTVFLAVTISGCGCEKLSESTERGLCFAANETGCNT